MFSYIWPIALVVLSNVVYQICAKSVPEGMNYLQVYATVAGAFRAVPPHDGKIAGSYRRDWRAALLQAGLVPFNLVGH